MKKKIDQFKSYYVVWKPEAYPQAEAAQKKFKSYYVVWKLFRLRMMLRRDLRFKSYYVVWKLTNIVRNCGKHSGLNRTMQYGNKETF